MIKVEQLTKHYAGTVAVDNLSFNVSEGEIVGFLGPNGAGKTTTMRILAGYLPATGGEIEVAGRDVFRESLEVRKRIGYLPENCPLYLDMRVDEYLEYRAGIKGVSPRAVRSRVDGVKEKCGLQEVGTRIIGQLSKGFRQRVGLADALVHDPQLLILDEPTVGLDPAQIRQVRQLIRELARTHTILLSTHILPEVETTCDRVLIINEGRIIASGTPKELEQNLLTGSRITVDIKVPEERARENLETLLGVKSVSTYMVDEWTVAEIECDEHEDPREAIFTSVVEAGWKMRELRQHKKTLEDVFVELVVDRNGGDGVKRSGIQPARSEYGGAS